MLLFWLCFPAFSSFKLCSIQFLTDLHLYPPFIAHIAHTPAVLFYILYIWQKWRVWALVTSWNKKCFVSVPFHSALNLLFSDQVDSCYIFNGSDWETDFKAQQCRISPLQSLTSDVESSLPLFLILFSFSFKAPGEWWSSSANLSEPSKGICWQ